MAVGAGATAGGLGYINYKMGQFGATTQEKLSQFGDFFGDAWNKVRNNLDFKPGSYGSSSGPEGSQGGSGGSSGSSGSSGGSSGGSGGNGDVEVAIVAAISAVGDDSDDQMDQMVNLTRKMIEIRNVLLQVDDKDTLKIPSIVVIGSQSSGKSSVLESIVGQEFLPKGGNMVTRRPIELTLVYTPEISQDYCEFPDLKLGKITDFEQVQRTLADLNKAVPEEDVVSADGIRLEIFSPHVPDLSLVDLPGYIQVVSANQPPGLKRKIAELCDKYIQEPNIILAISAADVDLANSTALRASRRVDPRGERTIGVVTKMDLVDSERGYEILTNREYPLAMGYVGVVTSSGGPEARAFRRKENLTQIITSNEKDFFSKFAEYNDPRIDVGILKLRKKLRAVLEKSMAASLRPTTRAIKKELEECAYQFKVEFNDRVLTPGTYLAQSVDSFKVNFKDLSSTFNRDEVKRVVRANIDQKVLDILAERYWNSPYEKDPAPLIPLKSLSSSASSHELAYWQNILDQAAGSLTKSGIGRNSAVILVDEIEKRMQNLLETSSFGTHPLAISAITDVTQNILETRYFTTAEQIENSIKPLKYEVEIDDREWASSREYAYGLLKEELRQCNASLDNLKRLVGSSKLTQVMKYIENARKTGVVNELSFSPVVIEKGKEALFLQTRADTINMRMVAIKSSRCNSKANKYYCPEVFMEVVAEKLTATSVLFLNFELLSDFYYTFPRELDNVFGNWNEQEIATFATQDPRIKRHVELQKRKDLLHLALRKIEAVDEMQRSQR